MSEKLYSIGEAARLAKMTTETLRHYDRIMLIQPSHTDRATGYRYYSEQEIIYLQIISMLKQIGLSLSTIKQIFIQDDLSTVIEILNQAEESANDKLKQLMLAKEQIRFIRTEYEMKLYNEGQNQSTNESYIRTLPERAIIRSNTLNKATVNTLWKYHEHFSEQLPDQMRKSITFKNVAGIYSCDGKRALYVECEEYAELGQLTMIPAGQFLCCKCNDANREMKLQEVLKKAEVEYQSKNSYIIEEIIFTGMLTWQYEIQISI